MLSHYLNEMLRQKSFGMFCLVDW